MQGTAATYRVVRTKGPHTLMEVIDVPGLFPGMRFWFLTAAVIAMELPPTATTNDPRITGYSPPVRTGDAQVPRQATPEPPSRTDRS